MTEADPAILQKQFQSLVDMFGLPVYAFVIVDPDGHLRIVAASSSMQNVKAILQESEKRLTYVG